MDERMTHAGLHELYTRLHPETGDHAMTWREGLRSLREALEVIPRASILIETDAPYLTPTPWRGRPNSSYLIPHTLRFMAEHLGTDPSMLAAQISSTTEEVYGSWDVALDAPAAGGR